MLRYYFEFVSTTTCAFIAPCVICGHQCSRAFGTAVVCPAALQHCRLWPFPPRVGMRSCQLASHQCARLLCKQDALLFSSVSSSWQSELFVWSAAGLEMFAFGSVFFFHCGKKKTAQCALCWSGFSGLSWALECTGTRNVMLAALFFAPANSVTITVFANQLINGFSEVGCLFCSM